MRATGKPASRLIDQRIPFIPKRAHFLVPAVTKLVEDTDSDLPDVLRSHLREACSEIRELKNTCTDIEHQLEAAG